MNAVALAEVPRGTARLEQIPLELIDVGDNVRVNVEAIDELAASIAEHGVLQPVKAIAMGDGRYHLVWGQRRVLAARKAGLTEIPAILEEVDLVLASERSIEQLVENLHRADLNPIDRAQAMRAVVDSGISQADLARNLGIGASTVANDLRLLETAPGLQELVLEGKLTPAHAKALGGLEPEDQEELGAKAVAGSWSAHEAERQAKWAKSQAKDRAARRAAATKAAADVVAALTKSVSKADPVYINDPTIAAAVTAAGWPAKSFGYDQVSSVDKACGCKGVVVDWYSYGSQKPTVKPACSSKEHRDARQKAERDKWRKVDQQREAERAKTRAAEDANLATRASKLRVALAGIPPIVLKLVALAAAEGGGDYADGLYDRRAPLDVEADVLEGPWDAIAGLDDQAALEEAAEALASLVRQPDWGHDDGTAAREAMDAWLADIAPAPTPERQAKKAATSDRQMHLEDPVVIGELAYKVSSISYPGRRPPKVSLRGVDGAADREVQQRALSWSGKAKAWIPASAVTASAPAVPTCRVCGCTDDRACEGGCSWVDSDLCSTCAA